MHTTASCHRPHRLCQKRCNTSNHGDTAPDRHATVVNPNALTKQHVPVGFRPSLVCLRRGKAYTPTLPLSNTGWKP